MARKKYADWTKERKAKADERSAKWRAANPERHKENSRRATKKWRLANLEWDRERARKYAAKKAAANPEQTKAYRRERQLKKYGLTAAGYDAMVVAQNGCCAICGIDKPGGRRRWHIDHNRKTGEVRRLLCHFCNVGLGHFKEDIVALQRAIDYLKEFQTPA